jgi:hypothetical protein
MGECAVLSCREGTESAGSSSVVVGHDRPVRRACLRGVDADDLPATEDLELLPLISRHELSPADFLWGGLSDQVPRDLDPNAPPIIGWSSSPPTLSFTGHDAEHTPYGCSPRHLQSLPLAMPTRWGVFALRL